jgi:hypothetical protein
MKKELIKWVVRGKLLLEACISLRKDENSYSADSEGYSCIQGKNPVPGINPKATIFAKTALIKDQRVNDTKVA